MEGAAAWGAGCAVAWGLSDFVARFAGRSVGAIAATFAMMVVGSGAIVLYMVLAGKPFDWHLSEFHWLLGIGLGVALGSLFFFHAVTHGPVSLAVPVVASYPAIAVPITVALGARPEPIHWAAMAGTMAGVWIVARAVSSGVNTVERAEYAPKVIRRTILYALASATIFAVSLQSADRAIDAYGPWQTVLVVRLMGALILFGFFMGQRGPKRFPVRSWPFLIAFGLLDTAGHGLLYIGLSHANPEFAVVASSGYSVITVMLARTVLREPISLVQWAGIGLVIGGIVTLSAVG